MQSSTFDLQPTLEGDLIRLRPLKSGEFEDLYAAASDTLIWQLHPQPTRYQRDVFKSFFDSAIASAGAFAVENRDGAVIGSSRYYDFKPAERLISIGYTFLQRKYWGGKFNLQLKDLMLGHAFKFVDQVEFQIGDGNLRSRRAIEKIGAKLFKHDERGGIALAVYRLSKDEWS